MKNMRDTFSVLLVCILLFTNLPSVPAEDSADLSVTAAEATETEAPAVAPMPEMPPVQEGNAIDGEAEESSKPSPDSFNAPEATVAPPEEAQTEADFSEGYACVQKAVNVYESEDRSGEPLVKLPTHSVFYALKCEKRSWRIVFAVADKVVYGWLDGGLVRPLDEDEINRYLQEKDASWQEVNGHPLMPLKLTLQPGGAEGEKDEAQGTTGTGEQGSGATDQAGASIVQAGNAAAQAGGVADAAMQREAAIEQRGTQSAPDAIAFNVESLILGVKEKRVLSVCFTPSGSSDSVKFSSSKKSVVTIGQDGTVKALKTGTATISVQSASGLTASCKVTVLSAPRKVSVVGNLRMGVGEICMLGYVLSPSKSAGAVSFSSNAPSVAAVDPSTGAISALSTGTASITVRTYNGKSAKCKLTVSAAPESVTLSSASIRLSVGQMVPLKAATVPAGSFSNVFHYTSENPSIANVDASGVVRAMFPGTTEISVETFNGKRAICAVEVLAAPSALQLEAEYTIGVGDKTTLHPVTQPVADVPVSLVYTSSKSSVAKVNSSGEITGVKKGAATITVKTQTGVTAICRIVVKDAPKKISLENHSFIGVGEKDTVVCTLSPSGCSGSVVFSSSAPSVAKVDAATGEIIALSTGMATIRARTYNGKTASCDVFVHDAPESVAFEQRHVRMSVGQQTTLDAEASSMLGCSTYSFAIENEDLGEFITSSEYGFCIVTALHPGTVTVTVETYNGKKDSCTVEIVAAPTGLKLGAESYVIGVGEKLTLSPETLPVPDTPATITYSSSRSSVATVNDSGLVIGVKTGAAVIEARTHNGVSANCSINVKTSPDMIMLSARSANLTVGDSLQLNATLFPSTSAGKFGFSSSNKDVASVDETGLVTALSEGSAIITAKTYNNCTNTCTITVKGKGLPQSLALDADEKHLLVGAIDALAANLPAGTASDISFASSDPEVVAIIDATKSSDALWTCRLNCLKAGVATITATTANGKVDSCRVTVYDEMTLDGVFGQSEDGLTGSAITWTASVRKGKADSYRFRFQVYKDQGAEPVADSGLISASSFQYTSDYPGVYNVLCTAQDGLSTITQKSGDVTIAARPVKIVSVMPDAANGIVNGQITVSVQASGGVGMLSYRYGVSCDGSEYLPQTPGTGPRFTFSCTKAGSYVITAQVSDVLGQTASKDSAAVTIRPAATSISIDVPKRIIDLSQQDKTISLSATCTPSNALQTVTWSSSSAAVAAVNANGLVTGSAPGLATITATAADGSGVQASVDIGVQSGPVAIASVTPDAANGIVNGRITVSVQASGGVGALSYRYGVSCDGSEYLPQTPGTGQSFTFSCSKAGNYIVTAQVSDVMGQTARLDSTAVTIRPAVSSISIAASGIGLDLNGSAGRTLQLSATCVPASALQAVVWSSSNTAVATVDESGLVTGVAPGTAAITATAADGSTVQASIDIPVEKTDFTYEPVLDVQMMILGFRITGYTGSGATVEIPSKIFGRTVLAIANAAFSGNQVISSVVVPDGVTEIQDQTFYNCAALTTVRLPNGITRIGEKAFAGCTSLDDIVSY